MHEHDANCNHEIRVSKTRFAKVIMPSVGDRVGDNYRVNYTNYAQFWFMVLNKNNEINIGDVIEYNGAIFKALAQNFETNKISFEFQGFKEPEPPKQDSGAVKILDD